MSASGEDTCAVRGCLVRANFGTRNKKQKRELCTKHVKQGYIVFGGGNFVNKKRKRSGGPADNALSNSVVGWDVILTEWAHARAQSRRADATISSAGDNSVTSQGQGAGGSSSSSSSSKGKPQKRTRCDDVKEGGVRLRVKLEVVENSTT